MKNLIFCVILAILLTGCTTTPDSLAIKTKDVTIIKEAESMTIEVGDVFTLTVTGWDGTSDSVSFTATDTDFVTDDIEIRAGATAASRSFSICDKSAYGFTDIDDAYAIITDITNGDMMHASTGAVDTTWTNCDIAFAKDAQNPYYAICTIPALSEAKTYAIVVYEDVGGDGSEANTDPVRIDAMLYDATTGSTYTDTNLYNNRRIPVKPEP